MKSSRKKIVRKKIRSKLGRKKRSKAKIRKMKGGADAINPTPLITKYNTLVFDIDGTILPGLCKNGSKYFKNEKKENDSSNSKKFKFKNKKNANLNDMVKKIIKYKDQILRLIKLLLEIKEKHTMKMVILTRCRKKNTLFHKALHYHPELTLISLFEKSNDLFEMLENLKTIIQGKYTSKEIILMDDKMGITDNFYENSGEISIIRILSFLFDESYDMDKLQDDCIKIFKYSDDTCKDNVNRQQHNSLLSAFVKASYFKNFVLDQDKDKVLFFDDEYINTMFVDGLGYDCVIPTETVKKEELWQVRWVNDSLEYLLRGTSTGSYFITSLMKDYKDKAMKAMKSKSMEKSEVLEDIKQHLTEHKSDETFFSDLYTKFMNIDEILYYKKH